MANKNNCELEFPYGVILCYPHSDGNAVKVELRGRFGRRKLRKMLREITPLTKKDEIEFCIDNFCTKLVPVDWKAQVAAIYEEGQKDAEAQTS